ncbi:MAG: hypothetical protein KGN84_01335 [Acidobacteriota bacterium]|nr:hypothetical protein [Acidobacteriota bacterium]
MQDYLYRFFHYIPYRCRNCGTRFYAYRAGEQSDSMRTREEQKIMRLRRQIKWKRNRREIAVFGAAGLLLVYFVYYLIQQRIVSE